MTKRTVFFSSINALNSNGMQDHTNSNTIQIHYYSFWMTRIDCPQVKCKRTDSQNMIFSKDDQMICLNDCLIFLSNQTYSCIDVERLDIFIDIEKHLFLFVIKYVLLIFRTT
jgi:hypothetical protein